jgi:hypothetical protein
MSKELRIYKPNGTGKGSAVKFQQTQKVEYKDKNGKDHYGWHCFVEFASQLPEKDEHGNAKFNWSSKDNPNVGVRMKIGELDAAKLLLVLNDEVESEQLFHDPNKAREESSGNKSNNICKIKRGDNGYAIEASSQVGKEVEGKVFIVVSWAEAVLLKAFLNLFLQRFYA